ncbi:QsdR family transcriptional regulator [Saccharopolyspora pogona]|uniref:QsdR family transcriptional regulator n=1 Tax=Saccharopolyspora pogona TaxID=333966 RepID=UPI001CC24E96|nr:QsdR family transcriptional regulator [Saccharopolyspora pogona]
MVTLEQNSEGHAKRLGTSLTRDAVLAAATREYLAGRPLDMSALASEVGIGRSTLYRLVGAREDLLSVVLGEAADRTFAYARKHTTAPGGAERIVEVMDRFMRAVAAARPLQELSRREPLVIVRILLVPGPVEDISGRNVADMLAEESEAGRLELSLPPDILGLAIIRICDAHLYAPLLGRTDPEIETGLDLVAALLGHTRVPRP